MVVHVVPLVKVAIAIIVITIIQKIYADCTIVDEVVLGTIEHDKIEKGADEVNIFNLEN